MNVEYNSLKGADDQNSDLTSDGFAKCNCGDPECDLLFIQKRTIIKLFDAFIKNYQRLPINLEFISVKDITDPSIHLMTVIVQVTQVGEIRASDSTKEIEEYKKED